MLTRPTDSGEDAVRRLQSLGADVVEMPLIRIVPPPDEALLAAAARRAGDYDWIAFTSVNAVEAFARALPQPGGVAAKIAVVGPATGRAARAAFARPPDLMPRSFTGAHLGAALATVMTPRMRALLVQAQDARPEALTALTRAGSAVDAVAAYATVEAPPSGIAEIVRSAHVVVLASGSAARSLASGLGSAVAGALAGKIVACIGPVTAEEARRAAIPVTVESREHSMDGVIDAVVEYVASR